MSFYITYATLGVITFLFMVCYSVRHERSFVRFADRDDGAVVWIIIAMAVVLGWPFALYDWSNKDPDGHT